jgi:hypothetical protein
MGERGSDPQTWSAEEPSSLITTVAIFVLAQLLTPGVSALLHLQLFSHRQPADCGVAHDFLGKCWGSASAQKMITADVSD